MSILRGELQKMEGRRERSRALRNRREMITAAVVGYTNAGKSTLLNRLSGSDLDAGDQLFMTLDPTARRLEFQDGLNMILVDTVGFIRDLPAFLVQAFRATFEEAASADLILLVADLSDPDAASQIAVVQKQLNELGAGSIPVLYVLNKMDEMKADSYRDVMTMLRHEKASQIVEISALTGLGLDQLTKKLAAFAQDSLVAYSALIPYREAGVIAHARDHGLVTREDYNTEAIHLEGRIRKSRIGPLLPWIEKE
mgnify:FL=1